MIVDIVVSEGQFPIGFDNDLIAFFSSLVVHVFFFLFLKSLRKTLVLVASILRILGHSYIANINLTNHFTALLLLFLVGHFLTLTALPMVI